MNTTTENTAESNTEKATKHFTRSEFFNIAKYTKSAICVKQYGENGYGISMMFKEDEAEQLKEITLMYGDAPRYFKSLNGVESTLKDYGILSFTVKLEKDEIAKRKNKPKEEEKA